MFVRHLIYITQATICDTPEHHMRPLRQMCIADVTNIAQLCNSNESNIQRMLVEIYYISCQMKLHGKRVYE